jgi:predicted XRE-type DNA-binding protein
MRIRKATTAQLPPADHRRTPEDTTTVIRVSADEHSNAKTELAEQVNRVLDASGLNQVEAGQVLGMSQSKVSALRNYKLRGISLERLLAALADLDQEVEIVVTSADHVTRTTVTA